MISFEKAGRGIFTVAGFTAVVVFLRTIMRFLADAARIGVKEILLRNTVIWGDWRPDAIRACGVSLISVLPNCMLFHQTHEVCQTKRDL